MLQRAEGHVTMFIYAFTATRSTPKRHHIIRTTCMHRSRSTALCWGPARDDSLKQSTAIHIEGDLLSECLFTSQTLNPQQDFTSDVCETGCFERAKQGDRQAATTRPSSRTIVRSACTMPLYFGLLCPAFKAEDACPRCVST